MRDFEEAILLVSMFQNVAMLAKECEFIDYDTFKKDPGSYDGYAVYDNEEGEIMFPDRFSGTRDLLLPLPSRPMYLECEGARFETRRAQALLRADRLQVRAAKVDG